MPWSYGDDIKREVLERLSEKTTLNTIQGVVDIGAGAGQWRNLSMEYPIGQKRWTALEGYYPYIKRFELRKRYDRIIVNDLKRIKYSRFPGHVFIFGDVVEHLDREVAVDVMRRACSMGTVVVVMPFLPSVSEEQEAVDGNELERHRFVWHWEDWITMLKSLGYSPDIIRVPPGDDRNKGATICWKG